MSNEVTNHDYSETPVRKRPNWLAIGLIALGGLLLLANLTVMAVGRTAERIAYSLGDGIVVRGVNADGSTVVIDDFDQLTEADFDRIEARIDAEGERIAAEADRVTAQIDLQAERLDAEFSRLDSVTDARIVIAPPLPVHRMNPFIIGRSRGPNLWGAAFVLLGLYVITRRRKVAPAAPLTGPQADPPAAA